MVNILAAYGLLDIIYKAIKMSVKQSNQCSDEEAKAIILAKAAETFRSLFKQDSNPADQLRMDVSLNSSISNAVRRINGESNYWDLVEIFCGGDPNIALVAHSRILGLPCMNIPFIYQDDNQKNHLSSAVSRIVKDHLAEYGLPSVILIRTRSYPNGIPYFEIVYGATKAEQEKVFRIAQRRALQIAEKHKHPTDDTGEDLHA